MGRVSLHDLAQAVIIEVDGDLDSLAGHAPGCGGRGRRWPRSAASRGCRGVAASFRRSRRLCRRVLEEFRAEFLLGY